MKRLLAFTLISLVLPVQASEPLRIAVAANFRGVLERINEPYSASTGQQIQLSSASTGVLASQIMHGAPFDLFFSADEEGPNTLRAADLGISSACYALGQVSLVGGDLAALQKPELSLAIANPTTAPYGRAAIEILSRPEFSDIDQDTLIRGTNVLQAFQFWRAGAVDLALVASSLAPAGSVIPLNWYQPIEQHLLVLKQSPQAAAYLQWLGSDTVRQMIIDAGYLPCP
ncbi:MAG: molybdate ABC transporter substrate-binding protein [Halioglobus sp.]